MLALGLSLTEPSLSPGDDLDFLIAHLPVLGISGEDRIYKHNSYLECKKISLLMFLFYNQFKIFIFYLICICVRVCLGGYVWVWFMLATVGVWRCKDHFLESVLFYLDDSWYSTQIARLGNKCLYPWNHLTGSQLTAFS